MAKFQIDKLEEDAKQVLDKGEREADKLVSNASQAMTESKYTMWIILGALVVFGGLLIWVLAR